MVNNIRILIFINEKSKNNSHNIEVPSKNQSRKYEEREIQTNIKTAVTANERQVKA